MGFENLTLKLIRHGESRANVEADAPWLVGDHNIGLTETGRLQAREAGAKIGAAFLRESLVYSSPYRRTRDTLAGLLEGAGLDPKDLRHPSYEDPRLRELEPGYADNRAEKREKGPVHGWFYYRYERGESAADCYDRTSGFIESMCRRIERKGADKVLIVSHGLTLRCFVMRFLHLTVEDYERMANPGNAAVITLERNRTGDSGPFSTPRWRVDGLEPAQWPKKSS